ncbi:MAG: S9 family peptidase [Gemmatimonadaceae bacterium]
MKRIPVLLALLAAAPGTGLQAQGRHPITFDDFAAVKGVSDPQISPDGGAVLYAVRVADVAANKRTTTTYLQPIAGGEAHPFPDAATHATEARWSPDGARIAFIAAGQLWIADASGANRKQLTTLNQGASGPVWAPTGDHIAFVSGVYAGCRAESCNADSAKARDTTKVKARIADHLMYRHWNAWDEGTRSHLFVIAPDGSGARDATEGLRYDVPPGPFGGSEAYAFSPDGKELAYTGKDQGSKDAWTTDLNVYTVTLAGGVATAITAGNPGGDQNPVYSPDGKAIAYASQARAGFESDRWRLMLYDRATHVAHELLPRWDRNADAVAFAPDSRSIFVQTEDAGRNKLYRFAIAPAGVAGAGQLLVGDHDNAALSLSRDGKTIAFVRDAADRPAEVFSASLGAAAAPAVRQLSHVNDELVSRLAMQPAEDFWFKGADGDSVQGFVVKPPNFDPSKKYPVVLLIHGGPQGAWLDQFHGRWNYQMFAAPGFGLVIINPRGSFGYGQKFVDQISKDWGGRVYTDLMNGLDYALQKNAWLDGTRAGAGGGSFGGYMVDWIAGHTDRFKALVSHAGPFNLENMYGATEELWFPEWEYSGPYWDPKAMAKQYRKFSPHLFARNFRTPTLVTGGELDYRVPYTEDLSFFTALQRQNVPSRLVMFPDEGHWIGKPQNQRLWWGEVQSWLTRYLTKPAA